MVLILLWKDQPLSNDPESATRIIIKTWLQKGKGRQVTEKSYHLSIIQSFLLLSAVILLTGCSGVVCKGEQKIVVFDYDPIFKTVDVGGMPTYFKGKNAPWVKKIIVKTKGFLVVSEQKIADYKKVPCEKESKKNQSCQKYEASSYYTMQSYIEGEGYKYWNNIPKEEWESISQLEDQPSQKPDLHIKNCHFSLFGSVLETLLGMIHV